MNSPDLNSALQAAIARILTPLVKVFLRNGVSLETFVEISKRVYVSVAEKSFKIPGKNQTTARIATLTGLSRKEVLKLRSTEGDKHLLTLERHNRASRVISAWVRDSGFQDKTGRPAALPIEAAEKSFTTLVKKYSGDITARTILEELIHAGAVKQLKNGKIKLITNAYVPKADTVEKIKILGTDVTDLIATIDHNLSCEPGNAFFQRKVWYNNIPDDCLNNMKKQIVIHGQAAIEKIDHDMSKCDRDSNPEVKGEGRKRAMIGIYYYDEDWADDK